MSATRDLLTRLAAAYGVDASYWSFGGERVQVPSETLVDVLAALGVDATTDEAARQAIEDAELEPWRSVLPEVTVLRENMEQSIQIHVPHGYGVTVDAELESGGPAWHISQIDDFTEPRLVDGHLVGQASFILPSNLPLGCHTLHARVTKPGGDEVTGTDMAPLIVVPRRLASPKERGVDGWGVQSQLYSIRSAQSWGIGDAADLTELGSFFGSRGAQFILINPVHSAQVAGHMAESPYLPVTRRFFNPIYIRPEDIREVAYLPPEERGLVERLGLAPKAASTRNTLIDRDALWAAKKAALDVIYRQPRSAARQRSFERFRRREGAGLENFAYWCALTEAYPEAFPAGFENPQAPAAQANRSAYADRIDFYAWLQWIVDAQFHAAQVQARKSGMGIGVMGDLAVGVHPAGADTWMMPEAFATGVSVGAPPDMYNQQGQDWSQPPFNPRALRRLHYRPVRDMVRTVMRNVGALRIDHVMGFFRLWWIPAGHSPADGTYVHYDQEAMMGVLLLEAQRAGVTLVGEDLGNVEPSVRQFLSERGVLGTSVMLFEQTDSGFKIPEQYREDTLTTVDTHDLPPAAGYLAGTHVELRERLGLLVEPVETVLARTREEKERLEAALRIQGLLGEDPTDREIVLAMHQFIARTPAQLKAIAVTDAVGERRVQNQPGTDQEYPNWRVPLADADGHVVLLEDFPSNGPLNALLDAYRSEQSPSTAE